MVRDVLLRAWHGRAGHYHLVAQVETMPASLLRARDIHLKVWARGDQRVQAARRTARGNSADRTRVYSCEELLKADEVGSHRQPQLISNATR